MECAICGGFLIEKDISTSSDYTYLLLIKMSYCELSVNDRLVTPWQKISSLKLHFSLLSPDGISLGASYSNTIWNYSEIFQIKEKVTTAF